MRILHMEQGLYVLLLEQSEDNYLGAYSLEDSCAQKVMELYEAPLQWEDAMCDTLADGRVVFVKAFENEDNGAGKVVPESVRICYVTIE